MKPVSFPFFRGVLTATLIVCWFGASPAATAQQGLDQAKVEKPSYQLGSGDLLKVTVFKHTDLSGEYRVDGSGTISFPLIGTIKAGGLTIQKLRENIVLKLKEGYLKNPSVSVEVLNFRPFYILGEVNQPGDYSYVSAMTVLNAVAMAGGFTGRAKRSDIVIIRANDPKRAKSDANLDTVVLPGDIIEVSQRLF